MAYENVLVDKKEGYATITLNRPKANALSIGLVQDIRNAVAELEADASVRCILVTGAGRFFSAGADVPSLQKIFDTPFVEGGLLAEGLLTMNAVEACTKPVVAVVNGMALGGGCELAMSCHLRIAAETAVFGQPEITLGIIPGWGGTFRLPRLIGYGRATEWLLTGRTVNAQEALEAGLVSKVVPADQLAAAAEELAGLLIKRPVPAMRATLKALYDRAVDTENGVKNEGNAFLDAASSKDAREGVAAFLEKREPNFCGE